MTTEDKTAPAGQHAVTRVMDVDNSVYWMDGHQTEDDVFVSFGEDVTFEHLWAGEATQ